jgi:hypothetical protein
MDFCAAKYATGSVHGEGGRELRLSAQISGPIVWMGMRVFTPKKRARKSSEPGIKSKPSGTEGRSLAGSAPAITRQIFVMGVGAVHPAARFHREARAGHRRVGVRDARREHARVPECGPVERPFVAELPARDAAVGQLLRAQIALSLLRVPRAQRAKVPLEHQVRRGAKRAREVEPLPSPVAPLRRSDGGVRSVDRLLHARAQGPRVTLARRNSARFSGRFRRVAHGSRASLSVCAASVAHWRRAARPPGWLVLTPSRYPPRYRWRHRRNP